MKTIKRIGAALLVLALLLSTPLPALSADPNPLSGDETEGSITIHKYVVDDLDKLSVEATGREVHIDTPVYDIGNSGQKTLDELQPLEGMEFTLVQVDPNDEERKPLNGGVGPIVKYTDPSGELTFDGLPFGLYRITEAQVGYVAQQNPIYVTVPLTDPQNHSDLIYDIHIYPKNAAGRELEKTIEDDLKGNEFPWVFSVALSSDVGDLDLLRITDSLDARLQYISTTAWFSDTEGNNNIGLTENTHYKVESSVVSNRVQVVFEIKAAGFLKLAEAYTGSGEYTPMLYVQVNTMLIDSLEEADLISIKNDGILHYGDYETRVEEGNEPEVDIGGFVIRKFTEGGNPANSEHQLSGAKFKIFKTEADAKALTNAIKNPADPDEDWVITSGADGTVNVYGLAYGTYWLVEIEAPPGYNLMGAPLEIAVNGDKVGSAYTVDVENREGFTLPLTGGAGTILFLIVGLSLITVAGVAYVLYRRRNANSNKAT